MAYDSGGLDTSRASITRSLLTAGIVRCSSGTLPASTGELGRTMPGAHELVSRSESAADPAGNPGACAAKPQCTAAAETKPIGEMRVNLPGRDLEHSVLAALWEHGPARARDVHRLVGAPRGLAYTTIATALDRLHTKALVERHKQGKTLVYRARVQRETIVKAFAREAVASLLGDRPQPAMAALVEAVEAVNPDLIEELERLVVERRRANKKGAQSGT